MAIALRKPKEIDKLRDANLIVAKTLNYLKSYVKPGITLKELDRLGEDYIRSCGAIPSFKGLYNFPASVCTSVNEVIIHGVPTDYVLKEGDIVGLDIGTKLDGWFGDAAVTLPVGQIADEHQKIMDASEDALYHAISIIKAGMRFKELSFEIEKFITQRGYAPLKDFCGHGIGKKPHEEPQIPNYLEGKVNQGPKIKNGMVFCLEPMLCTSDKNSKILSDKWSVVSLDGKYGSHYEHTVAIINNKAEILSKEID
jgi:methionyl aminopeptidase